ncbi:N-acetylmuramoyl-L-alanine amidase [Clostridium tarantellae]|uniref:MurNAc-LAA domain-containing protein n=1 Tax=Clostridium tarantellae TaxID=39493 RepID=A0A6I1MSJ1_9CLOT|nr:N-acetylmuramoyl-L-alanine amidase [Clostridium tarantellae]MPQ43219.1 hypothetical protein [Clostridium tarantellae]
MYLAEGAIISGDASHNCYPDKGIIGLKVEEECTKEIWNLIREKFKKLKFNIVDCTPWNKQFSSVGESLYYRVKKANETSSVLHLCIDFRENKSRGVECWINEFSERSEKFALNICKHMQEIGYYNRGVKNGPLYITNYTKMPCILIRCCSLNSIEDMKRYNAENIAEAIVKGITNLGTK